MMKILFIGDISGKPGRHIVRDLLPGIKAKYKPDITIANAENSAGGIGITIDILRELIGYGIDFFTGGDHVWRIKGFVEDLEDKGLPIVRPYNYEQQKVLPGKGWDIIDLGTKGRLVVSHFVGRSFMRDEARNPFWAFDDLLLELEEAGITDLDSILIDFHAEATAEKLCFADYVKNKAAAVVGTHTHVPTCDTRLLGDTAYVTDVGMTGPLNASLWIKFPVAIHNFKYPMKKGAEMEEEGEQVFNSVLIETQGNHASSIIRVDEKRNK